MGGLGAQRGANGRRANKLDKEALAQTQKIWQGSSQRRGGLPRRGHRNWTGFLVKTGGRKHNNSGGQQPRASSNRANKKKGAPQKGPPKKKGGGRHYKKKKASPNKKEPPKQRLLEKRALKHLLRRGRYKTISRTTSSERGGCRRHPRRNNTSGRLFSAPTSEGGKQRAGTTNSPHTKETAPPERGAFPKNTPGGRTPSYQTILPTAATNNPHSLINPRGNKNSVAGGPQQKKTPPSLTKTLLPNKTPLLCRRGTNERYLC